MNEPKDANDPKDKKEQTQEPDIKTADPEKKHMVECEKSQKGAQESAKVAELLKLTESTEVEKVGAPDCKNAKTFAEDPESTKISVKVLEVSKM